MMSEYDLGPRAYWTVPVSAAFVLLMAARDRAGDSSAPSFADSAVLRARAQARRVLSEHYCIVPDPQLPAHA